MSFLKPVLFTVMCASGAALAERIIDPFERHAHDYSLEGPQGTSEVFYLSSNWYDEHGGKHDDRVGDSMLAAVVLSGAGAVTASLGRRENI
jgi:hypothetical protein